MRKAFKMALLAVGMTGVIGSLSGCGQKVSLTTINEGYHTSLAENSAVVYDTKTNIQLTSNIYGEDFIMSWQSTDSTERILGTGDYHTYREVDAKAFEKDLSEKVDNTIIGGDRYTTYDGKNYFKTSYSSNATNGVLDIVNQILADPNASLVSNNEGNEVSGKLTGPYLPYLFDKTGMTGLLDFKAHTDKDVNLEYKLVLDKKTSTPKQLDIKLTDIASIMSEVVSGMSNESGTIKTTVDNFTIGYTFKSFSPESTIKVSDAMVSASVVDNIDEMSVMAVESDQVDRETVRDVQIASFKFTVSDAWEQVDMPGAKGYEGVASDGKAYSVTRLKYKLSEARIDIMNPVTLDKLLEELGSAEGAETETEAETEATAETEVASVEPEYNINEIASAQVNSDMDAGYDSVYIDNGENQRYVMSSKGDVRKEYKFTVFAPDEFLRMTITTDGSELYNEYYTETISKVAESLEWVGYPEEPEETASEIESSTEGAEETGAEETTEAVEQLVGTAKNPYGAKDSISMKGIDLTSGNIVTESAVVMSMNTDKILVDQKIKQAGISVDGDAAMVTLKVKADTVKHTDGSSVNLDIHVGLADTEGNPVGELLNDGSPLGDEYKDGVIFTEDNQEKTLTFVFQVPDNFNEDENLLQIRYNDPDLGERSLFVRLK